MRMHLLAGAGFLAALIGRDALAQQAGGTTPPGQAVYQTRGIVLDARKITDLAGAGYWPQKLGEVFKVAVDTRLQNDTEECDAVLAAAWQVKPQAVSAEKRIFVIIPKRPAKPQSKDIAYQISFLPRAGAQEQDRVEALFISEGPGIRPVAIPPPAAGPTPRMPGYTYAGFPENNIVKYWAEHPDELKSIVDWIGTSASANFDQIVTPNIVKGTVIRSAYFHVKGTKIPSGPVISLNIEFLGEAAPVTPPLPAQFGAKDFADWQIEKIQADGQAQGNDKLGAITGLAELPAEERFPAKAAIWQYFKGGTRNAEVDAIAPIPNTDRRALLTLRFDPGNNVSVQHIGVDRKGSILGHLGDVRQVSGFTANSADVSALTAWLKKRYPAVTPKGATVAEIVASANADIQSKSGTPAWFKDNYGIDVLAASAAPGELTRSFQYKDQQLLNLEDFTPSELQVLEVVLEKISDHLVAKFKGLQMVRQKTSVEMIGVTATKLAIDNFHEAGVAVFHGNGRLIVIFDTAHLNSEALFVGGVGADGKPQIADESFTAFAHELGHMVAAIPGTKEALDGMVKAKNLKPVTWYAASNPKNEFFPEAFALYLGDPEWLKGNRPDLFSWFETLNK